MVGVAADAIPAGLLSRLSELFMAGLPHEPSANTLQQLHSFATLRHNPGGDEAGLLVRGLHRAMMSTLAAHEGLACVNTRHTVGVTSSLR
jgi:hypothetical protein